MSTAVEAKTEALKHRWYIYNDKLAIVKKITDDDTTNWGDPDKSKVVTYFGTILPFAVSQGPVSSAVQLNVFKNPNNSFGSLDPQ